jgi:hypothetical protein
MNGSSPLLVGVSYEYDMVALWVFLGVFIVAIIFFVVRLRL